MRFITCFSFIFFSIFSISGQVIQDLYPTMSRESVLTALMNNEFTITGNDSNNTIIDDIIKEEEVSIILGKTKEICVGRPISNIIDCTQKGGFTEDIDANIRVAILGTISCDEKKYYIIEMNRNRIMVNAIYIKIDKDLSFNEISNITHNSKYKNAIESYSEDLNNNRNKEFKTYLDNQKSVGIILMNYTVEDVSEVTDGVTAKFEVFNPTNKTIKYVTFYVSGINAVGDKVYNIRQQSYVSEFRGVGPIKSKESASYEWEYAWFTDVVETLKIVKIKIQYMDGSTKNVTIPKSIILPSKYQFQLQEYIDNL